MLRLDVVVPTRNRPRKLRLCLDALAAARKQYPFRALVCDSTKEAELVREVREVCRRYEFARLLPHSAVGVGGGRNVGIRSAEADLVVSVDDDVYVEPGAILKMVETYDRGSGWRVVAGSVAWGDHWSRPIVKRPIGYGRDARGGEAPTFLIGAFLLYPRALALACPWTERIPYQEDIFMGALWRRHGVQMLFAPDARAHHDQEHNTYGLDKQDFHVYTNLFDTVVADPSFSRTLSYELLGFAGGVKTYCRNLNTASRYIRAWYRGHRAFFRDWAHLRQLVSDPLPKPPEEPAPEARP